MKVCITKEIQHELFSIGIVTKIIITILKRKAQVLLQGNEFKAQEDPDNGPWP